MHIGKDVWQSPPDRGGGWTTTPTLDDKHLVECVSVAQVLHDIEIGTQLKGSILSKNNFTVSDQEYSRLVQAIKTNGLGQVLIRNRHREIERKAVLQIHDLHDRWRSLENLEAVPHPATAIA